MSDRNDIIAYYEALKNNPKPDSGLAYTCNCGWIDAGHARPTGARKLWQQFINESEKFTQNGKEGFKVNAFETGIKWGMTIQKHSQDFFVLLRLSDAEKEQVALSIFQEVSLGFETLQSTGFVGGIVEWWSKSSFSAEDLVSNIVGFYRAVRGETYDWRSWCKPVSKEASLKVWDNYGATGDRKNVDFLPTHHPCDECAETARSFPSQYQLIKPIEKGILHFDYDEVFAVKSYNDVWTPYPIDTLRNRLKFNNGTFNFASSRNSFGLGYVDFPKEVTLPIIAGETQYLFTRRALMVAAFNAGLNYSEQLTFVNKFFPLGNAKSMLEFRLDWRTNDPSNDNDSTVKQNEFTDFYGKEATMPLSPKQIREIERIRANKFSGGRRFR